MTKFVAIVCIAFFLCLSRSVDASACINEDPCVCEIDETKKIDLRQLSQKLKIDDFLDAEDLRGNTFFFHGCTNGTFNSTHYNFHLNDTKKVFSGSLIHVNTTYVNVTVNGTYYNTTAVNFVQVAKSSEIKFVPVSDKGESYQLVYKSGEKVTARIQLICNQYEIGTSFIKILSTDGTDPSLALTSPNACIIAHNPGLSTGSVLLILFFVSFGIYFLGGCIILYFMRGARGLEMIPNIDFWRSLPGLAKDGFIFLFSGCNPSSIATPETYDRI